MRPAGELADGSMAASALESAREALREQDEARAMVEAAVRADGTRPLVLVLRGDGGVGKTTLAVVAHLTAVVERRRSTFVPASHIEPTISGARGGLENVGLDRGFASLGWGATREVLVIDGFEQLHAISAWFFAELLAGAGANLTVIIASRRPLSDVLAPFATMIDVVELELEAGSDEPVEPRTLRQALSVFHAGHLLESNPLAQRFGGPGRVAACREWLRTGIAELGASPSHADLAEVLEATYLRGAVKQRAAAAELNLPWGTYRHRLRRALETLGDVLTHAS